MKFAKFGKLETHEIGAMIKQLCQKASLQERESDSRSKEGNSIKIAKTRKHCSYWLWLYYDREACSNENKSNLVIRRLQQGHGQRQKQLQLA